jgi:hypothetical protein
MRQHRGQPLVVPARVFAPFIVRHPELGVAFCKALVHGPAASTAPAKGAQGRARWGMTDRVRLCGLTPQWLLDPQPDGALGQTILAPCDALAGQRVCPRPWRAFCNRALIPARQRKAGRHRRHGAGGVRGGYDHPLGADVSFLEGRLVLRAGALEPAAGGRRHRDTRRHADTRVYGGETVRALALEAIRHHVLARPEPSTHAGLPHRRRQLRLALTGHLRRDMASGPPGGIRLGTPPLRQPSALVPQGLARPRGIASTHAALTMLPLASGATVWPRDPHGVLALFDAARLSEPQDALGSTQGRGHALLGMPPPLLLLPPSSTAKPLEPADRTPFDMEGHRLKRLAFARAAWADPISKAMGPRLPASQTVVTGGRELPPFVPEAFYITRDDVKRGNGTSLTIGPTGWEHTRPPAVLWDRQEQRTEWLP